MAAEQTSKIVQSGVTIAGTIGGAAAVGANYVVGLVFDDQHQIADVEI